MNRDTDHTRPYFSTLMAHSLTALSEIVCGISRPPGEQVVLELDCFREVTEKKNCNWWVRIARIETPADLLTHLDEIGVRMTD